MRCALAAAVTMLAAALAHAADPPRGFVEAKTLIPDLVVEMRYATARNFIGRPRPGYKAPRCFLTLPAAKALRCAADALRPRGFAIKVYDCYRPQAAVRAFAAWVKSKDFDPRLKRYHPNLERSRLISLGYIARVSRHSRGDAVDVTLVKLPTAKVAAFSRSASYGPCTAPAEARAPDSSVDMGTSFDCFDRLSHTGARDITKEQRRWRRTLVEAMAQQGFHNYRKEWWHFTYMPSRRGPAFSAPILPRRPRG
jgi:D-alanyl-D-alanine dipeptidase